MKILYICNRFYPALGGVETHVLNLAKKFIEDGDSVDVVCSNMVSINSSERFGTVFSEIEGIQVGRLRSFKIFGLDPATIMPYLPIFLIGNIRKYDIIHAHSYGYFSSWMPILICKLLNKKIIYTAHYADETVLPMIVKRIFDFLVAGWSFRMATSIIALTVIERKNIIKKFKVDPRRITIIPNGINLEEYSKKIFLEKERIAVLTKYGIENRQVNIITVARIAKNKGHIYLLQAFKEISGCNLIMVGKDWGEKERLLDYIEKNNIKNVFFLENINDKEKNKLLKSADVFVLPSLGGEAFGIVLLEAMASGLPVVASNVGGISDLVQDGKNGFLVLPRNAIQLKKSIMSVLDNPDYILMQNYCREFTLKYDWKIIQNNIKKLYQEVLILK